MDRTTFAAFDRTSRLCGLISGLVIAAAALSPGPAQAQSTPESVFTRGELLYSTHCIECHTTQMHWRARRQARDWPTLQAQVRRWQDVKNLGWSEADISDVTRYLNDTIYRFAPQVSDAAQVSPVAVAPASGSPTSSQAQRILLLIK